MKAGASHATGIKPDYLSPCGATCGVGCCGSDAIPAFEMPSHYGTYQGALPIDWVMVLDRACLLSTPPQPHNHIHLAQLEQSKL